VLVLVMGAWELFVDLGGADPVVLPAPNAVASSIWNYRSLLWSDFLVTGQEVVFGIALAALAGLGFAIALHFSGTIRRSVYPLLIGSQAVPIVIFANLLVIWLWFGIWPKAVVVAIVSFFPILVTTLAGLAAVDPNLLKLTRTFDASRGATFRHVEFPSALPRVLTGAKIAVAVAVIGAVLAENGGASSGLGYLFFTAQAEFATPLAYAAVVILCLFAIALFALLSVAERLALPWAYQPRGDLAA
jgi:NitT/TauT family transport system permease protein/putative hydroxymethylpyrimidine transport system permease protein